MPWRCPACDTPIRHRETEEQPRRGVLYRCHLCRIELVLDLATSQLTAAGPPDRGTDDKSEKSR